MKRFLITCITIYQHTLSPDHGYGRLFAPHAGCRFAPTCSEYMKDAVRAYGPWRGLRMGFARLGRCHPFSRGGYDPVS